MAAPAKKAEMNQVRGADLKRFVVQSTLLSLIDPVRGEPTRTPLDEDPEGDTLGRHQLKQKFLDSFALICSTSSSGAETASAVCLEQHAQAGAVLRVARNCGLTPKDLTGLEKVLQILRAVARKETSSKQAEPEILRLIVELDRGRILSIAERVERGGIGNFLREAHSRLLAGQVKPETRDTPGLRLWLEKCPFSGTSLRTWNSVTMAVLIEWASQARWLYSERLQDLLGPNDTPKPPWLDKLYKIARYHSAVKSMVKFAAKQPEIWADIQIKEIKAPDVHQFSLRGERALLPVLVEKLVGKDSGVIMERLEKHLNTLDAETKLRKACPPSLTLHAEMQIVVFYEGNPSLAPQMPFIGTSKKACFLCHEYLLLHPLRLRVSACHQKIYPSWMPPPYSPTTRNSKSTLFMKLSRNIEQLTKRELKTALTVARRPKNYDSTAGPSLTITATLSTALELRQLAIE